MDFTVTLLGTGTSQGVPIIGCKCSTCISKNKLDKRLRSSIHIQSKTTSVVIDSGPDFRYQMLRENINKLDALVFTHEHKDHTAGFDDIRAFNYIQQKDIDVYLNKDVEKVIRKDFDYVFASFKYPGVPQAKLHRIEDSKFTIGDLIFEPIKALHYKLPVLGYRIGNFTYLTDANYISEEEKNKIRGSEILVVNALRKEKHISHFTLQEAINLANELNIPLTYFTHISHQLGLHDVISKELPENCKLAFDGLKLDCK